MIQQRYRRKKDRFVVDAYQYGEGKPWTQDSISKVVAFMTGIDVDNHTGVSNERILDVVRPILHEWDKTINRTPIEVANWPSHVFYRVDLGDWIVRLPMGEEGSDKAVQATHVFVKNADFWNEYETVQNYFGVYKSQEDLDIEDLTVFIWEEVLSDLKDEEKGQELSKKAGELIIKAGWRKK